MPVTLRLTYITCHIDDVARNNTGDFTRDTTLRQYAAWCHHWYAYNNYGIRHGVTEDIILEFAHNLTRDITRDCARDITGDITVDITGDATTNDITPRWVDLTRDDRGRQLIRCAVRLINCRDVADVAAAEPTWNVRAVGRSVYSVCAPAFT